MTPDAMSLREIAIGGIYFSPLLIYAAVGLVTTLLVRALLHHLLGSGRLWYQAWFDSALLVITTAAVAFACSAPALPTPAGTS